MKEMTKNLILFGYLGIIIYIVITNSLSKFLNTRLYVYVYLTIPVLVLFMLINLAIKSNKNFKFNERVKANGLIYFLPIVLGIIANTSNLSDKFVQSRTNINNITVASKGIASSDDISYNDSSEESDNPEDIIIIKDYITQDKYEANSNKEEIVMNDSIYVESITNFYENLDEFVGRKIKIVGLAYKDKEDLNNDKFALGKYFMYCCLTDLQMMGLLCNYDKKDVVEDSWYEADAVIEAAKYEGQVLPVLNIKKITKVQQPINIFVN